MAIKLRGNEFRAEFVRSLNILAPRIWQALSNTSAAVRIDNLKIDGSKWLRFGSGLTNANLLINTDIVGAENPAIDLWAAVVISVERMDTPTVPTNAYTGISNTLKNETPTGGTSTMYGHNVHLTNKHAADSGSLFTYGAQYRIYGDSNGSHTAYGVKVVIEDDIATAYGLHVKVHDATTSNTGLYLNVEDGGDDIKIVSSADTGDYFTIQTTTHGATTFTTVDDDAAAANLTFTIDGAIKLDGLGVEIENDSTSGAPALLIDNDDTDQVALSIAAANIDANVIDVTADALTTATAIAISTDARTTGTALDISDSNTSDSAGSLVKIAQTGDRAGSAASYGLHIDFNTVANVNAKALYIDSEQTTGVVFEIDATEITTGKGISMELADRTTGVGLRIRDNGTSDSAGSLVNIIQSGDRAGSAASVGLNIDFDTTANAAARALKIDSEQTTGIVFELDADAITTGTALDITADALTTGGILNLVSNSSSTSTRSLVKITNDNTAATGTTLLHLKQDATPTGGENATLLIDTSATSTAPTLELRDSSDGNKYSSLNFNRSGATPADDMGLGYINFRGLDDGANATTYALMSTFASDITHGDEGGLLKFEVFAGGTAGSAALKELLTIGGEDVANSTPCAVVINEDGIDCDFRVESDDNTHMFFIDGNDNTVAAGGIDATNHKDGFAVFNDFNVTTFENTLADGQFGSAEILRYSPGANDTLTDGQIYFLHTDGTWDSADADDVATGASQMLGVGLGNAREVGVLIKGFVRIPSTEILNLPGSGAVDGLPLYVSTTAGHFDFTAPSGNDDFVRIVGYAIDDDSSDVLVYFDPDKTWVKVTA